MKTVAMLCAPMMRILDTVADGHYYLQSVAVDEEARGQGIGSTLIETFEDRARLAGATHLSLDVSATNESAMRLYERRGMTVVSQWPKRLAIPGFRLLRMTKML
jgi:ribosomal protein S18 acetylase RimI-like enzyme